MSKSTSFKLIGRVLFLIVALGSSYLFAWQHFSSSVVSPAAALQNLIQGEARIPYQYRVLVPWFVGKLSPLVPDHVAQLVLKAFPFEIADLTLLWEIASNELALFLLVDLFALFAAILGVRKTGACLGLAPVAAVLCALSLPILLACQYVYAPTPRFWYPSDMLAVCIITWGIYFALADRLKSLFALVVIGTFNRETTLILVFLYLLLNRERGQARFFASILFSIWLMVKLTLLVLFRANGGAPLHPNFFSNIGLIFDPAHSAGILGNFWFLWMPALLYGVVSDRPKIRALFWSSVLYFVIMLMVGHVPERRIFGEIAPFIALMSFSAITWLVLKLIRAGTRTSAIEA